MNLRQNKLMLNKLVEANNKRTLTSQEKTQYRLFNACVQGVNQALAFCENLIDRVVDGMSPHLNFSISTPNIVFTDPATDNFWYQSKHLDEVIPDAANGINDPRFDIKKILSLPSEERQRHARNQAYDLQNSSSIAELMSGHVINRNANHPLHKIFITLVQLTNHPYDAPSFLEASTDIFNVARGKPSKFNADEFILKSIADIPPAYVFLACEQNRMKIADEIQGIDPLDKLRLVSKTALVDVIHYGSVAVKQRPFLFSEIVYANDIAFDQLSDNELKTLLLLLKFTGNMTAVLSFFDTSSPVARKNYLPQTTLPEINEFGEYKDSSCYNRHEFAASVPPALSYIHNQIFQSCTAATASIFMQEFFNFHQITYEGLEDTLQNCQQLIPPEQSQQHYFEGIIKDISMPDSVNSALPAITMGVAALTLLLLMIKLARPAQTSRLKDLGNLLFWKPVNSVKSFFVTTESPTTKIEIEEEPLLAKASP